MTIAAERRLRTIAVRLRTWWRPILTAVMLCLAMLLIGPSDPLDRRLSDRLLVRQALPAEPAWSRMAKAEPEAPRTRPAMGKPGCWRCSTSSAWRTKSTEMSTAT